MHRESYFCTTHGNETFKFASPAFKQSLYGGMETSKLPSDTSPVDLFHEPLHEIIDRFPLLQMVHINEVHLSAGQCLFVPAWWWVQTNTPHDGESIYT
jgi:hypothetical protein